MVWKTKWFFLNFSPNLPCRFYFLRMFYVCLPSGIPLSSKKNNQTFRREYKWGAHVHIEPWSHPQAQHNALPKLFLNLSKLWWHASDLLKWMFWDHLKSISFNCLLRACNFPEFIFAFNEQECNWFWIVAMTCPNNGLTFCKIMVTWGCDCSGRVCIAFIEKSHKIHSK